MSVPILGTINTFEAVLERLTARGERPQKVVLTMTISGQRLRELRTLADKAQISLVRLPRLVDFEKIADDGKIEFRPIVLEDLLRRPAVTLNQQAIERMIEGRRIVITGAGGSVGSELSRQIAQRRPGELVLLDVSEFNLYTIDREIGELSPSVARRSVLLDIRDRASIEHLFDTCRPEIVFHAAALKHVTLVESNPIEGVRTNAFGTRNVADAAHRCGAETFIQISTDKAVRPTCVMGATKRLAEFYCQALDRARRPNGNPTPATRFVIVRFGNVLGSRGSVIPLFEKQLQRGGPLTVTDPNVTRFFMSIREAVELVLQASGSGTPAGDVTGLVHVLDMGEPVRIFEVAEHMIRLAGFRPQDEVRIEFTGLRQGEKLHEELFDPAEKAVENGVAGVFVVRSKVPELSTLAMAFSRLEYACAAQDEAAVKRQLKCIVLPQIGDARTVEGAFN
jgi:O-antigen biosynthesis protein WbqV